MSYFTDHIRDAIARGYFLPQYPTPQGMLQQSMQPYMQLAGDITPFGTMGQSAGQVPGSFGNISRTLQELANHYRVPQMYGGADGWGVPQIGPQNFQYMMPPANQ